MLGPLTLAATSPCGLAQVLIRPEQITIHPESTTDGISVRVSEVAYFGHDATVRLRPQPDGPTVTARIIGAQPPAPGTDGSACTAPYRPTRSMNAASLPTTAPGVNGDRNPCPDRHATAVPSSAVTMGRR
jgi:TOBE domain